MKKRIISLLLALITVINLLPVSAIDAIAEYNAPESEATEPATEEKNDDYVEGLVELKCEGKTSVTLGKGDKLYAMTELDPSIGNKVRYSWELMTDSGKWASISGYVFYYAIISEALIGNAIGADGTAKMRCIATANDKKYVSNVLTITEYTAVTDEGTTLSLGAGGRALAPGRQLASSEPETRDSAHEAFNIVINYTYLHLDAPVDTTINGGNAANTFTVTLPKNAYYTGTVATPPEIGYLPYVEVQYASYVTGNPPESEYIEYHGVDYVPANSIQFTNQTENITLNVYFIPQEVTYRVNVFEQNLYDDEYTLAETITYTGIANSAVGEGKDTPRKGYTPLYYVPDTEISEDGSFAIDIYYDRNYYLVEFDLQDPDNDAYGAPNYYVRYQTPVMLQTPSRPAHSFQGWTLTEVTDDNSETVVSHSYPTSPAGGYLIPSIEANLKYKANWKVEKTSYTIIYWLENAENDQFTLHSFDVISNVDPGTPVDATDTLSSSDKSCFKFSKTLSDKQVPVSADGTTAVNAYYTRNYYTLTFKGEGVCITTDDHVHSNETCLNGNCGLEPHSHTQECGVGELTCGKTVHVHEDSCCSIEEHAHTGGEGGCCTIPYHVHGSGSSSDCTKTEHTAHHASCYSRNDLKEAVDLTDSAQISAYTAIKSKIAGPLNGYVYRIRIRSGMRNTIYNFLYVHEQWFYLGTASTYNGVTANSISNPGNSNNSTASAEASTICGLELHTHGDGTCDCPHEEHDHTSGCTCSIPRHVHGEGECDYTVCGKEQHRHSVASCYTHLCGRIAHTHTASCVRNCQPSAHTHTSSCQTKKTQNFLTLSCKYNQDVSQVWRDIWVLFPNGERWDPSAYFEEVLVYMPFMPPANITFTENEGTSSHKTFNISYYLESLDGTGTEYDGKYFDLSNTVVAKYSYLTPAEDFFDILGFTQYASTPGFSGNQITTSPVSFYYSRNEYTLKFVSLGTTLSPYTKTLKYQQPIGASYELFAEDIPYPSNKEEGAIKFAGWYTTSNFASGTEFYFDGSTTMPIGGLVLYAKWEPCSYTVNIYTNAEMDEIVDTQTVYFDSAIAEPDYSLIYHPGGLKPGEPHPDYDDPDHMIFAGWYYTEGGEPKRFDFNTMTVKGDMEIYAKWTSRQPVYYSIRYVYFDGEKYVDIAEETTGASLAGITKTFHAKVDNELEKPSYFPEVRTHSITMSSDDAENAYMFVYSAREEVHYTVNHTFTDDTKVIIDGEETTVFESIFGSNTLTLSLDHKIEGEAIKTLAAAIRVSFREGVTKDSLAKAVEEQYPEVSITNDEDAKNALWSTITNMSPNLFIQRLVLTTNDASNVATFQWKNQGNQARYQVIYYKESIDGNEYVIDSTDSAIVPAGTLIEATIKNINYFDFNPADSRNKLSGTATKMQVDPQTGALTQGLVLSVYYTRKTYEYNVYHYDSNSGIKLAGPITMSAKYQHKVSIGSLAMDIPGYTLKNGNDVYEITANNAQTVICYYTGLSVYYQYQVLGMGGTIGSLTDSIDPTDTVTIGANTPETKIISIWNEGYFFNGWTYSIGDGARMPLPDDWQLSNGGMAVTPSAPGVDLAGKTVYVFAEVLPTTRRFSVEGYISPENDPQAFVFRLQGAEAATEHIDLTFIIFDVGYTDITHLPYGTYTLTTLHWAWRLGHPSEVAFNGEIFDAATGTVTLELNTTGDVIITYPSSATDKWISDDASGVVPILPASER